MDINSYDGELVQGPWFFMGSSVKFVGEYLHRGKQSMKGVLPCGTISASPSGVVQKCS